MIDVSKWRVVGINPRKSTDADPVPTDVRKMGGEFSDDFNAPMDNTNPVTFFNWYLGM